MGYDPVVSSDLVREKDVATLFFKKVSITWFKRRLLQLFSLERSVHGSREGFCNYFLLKDQFMVQEKDVATIFFKKVSITWFKRRMLQLFSLERSVHGSRKGCCNYFL